MKVNVILTHARGRSINVHRLEQERIFAGDLIVYLAAIEGLRRASRIAALRPLARSLGEHVLPDLHDVELIAFGERAMMLNGFEEVDGSRYYQGWWVRWE
jgi:hypothetical protein